MLSTTFSSESSFSREKKKQKELQTRPEPVGQPTSTPGNENAARTGDCAHSAVGRDDPARRPTDTDRITGGGPGRPTLHADGHSRARPYLTLLKKDLTRFWPLWAAYTVLWFLLIPLEIFNQGAYMARTYAEFGLTGWAGHWAMQQVCELHGAFFFDGITLSAVYGVLCAMAVWSYLYSARSANMTHALPVRREGQFAAHFLSGTAFFVLPHALIFVLTMVAGLATGSRGDLLNAAGAMGILSLLCLFFFSLATLCAFVTGHLLALPAFYLIINFLVYGLTGLLDRVSSRFLFGPATGLSESEAVMWLTPVATLGRALDWNYEFVSGELTGSTNALGGIPRPENGSVDYAVTTRLEGLHVVLIYAAVGLLLAGLALLLYRRRHLETAGDVVAVPWLRPVFQYGVAFCAALAGTYILADLLGRADRTVLTVLLVLCGVVGFFAARMLLQKSLRVFKTGWKGALAVAAVIVVLCLGLTFDVLGVERVIPDADQVASVRVLGPNSGPGDTGSSPALTAEDPALIQRLLAVHQTVIDHRKELKANLDAYRSDRSDSLPEGVRYRGFEVTYTLQNGGFLRRNYELIVSPAELEDPNSVASALDGLLNDPAFNRLNYELDDVEADRLTEVGVNGLENAEKGEATFYSPLSDHAALEQQVEDAYFYEYESGGQPGDRPAAQVETRSSYGLDLRPASTEELAALWRAVLADFDAGNLGRRWLFSDSDEFDEKTCAASLEFYWNTRVEDGSGEVYYRQDSLNVQLTPQAANTFKALEELGLFEDGAYIANYNGERVYPR